MEADDLGLQHRSCQPRRSDAAGTQLFQYQAGQDRDGTCSTPIRHSARAWLRGYKDLVNGPMIAANVNPVIDARYNSFLANGMTPAFACNR
jgi:hypothetical protein